MGLVHHFVLACKRGLVVNANIRLVLPPQFQDEETFVCFRMFVWFMPQHLDTGGDKGIPHIGKHVKALPEAEMCQCGGHLHGGARTGASVIDIPDPHRGRGER